MTDLTTFELNTRSQSIDLVCSRWREAVDAAKRDGCDDAEEAVTSVKRSCPRLYAAYGKLCRSGGVYMTR